MGKLVLVVPGSPLDPRSEGTNRLIREGATLVTGADDILEALTPLTDKNGNSGTTANEEHQMHYNCGSGMVRNLTDETRQKIIAALGPSPVCVDDIIQFTDASPGEVQLTLLELSLAGRI